MKTYYATSSDGERPDVHRFETVGDAVKQAKGMFIGPCATHHKQLHVIRVTAETVAMVSKRPPEFDVEWMDDADKHL